MEKRNILDILMLLSALESWSFSVGKPLPENIHENLTNIIDELSVYITDEAAQK
jgi:hypothetical protein